MSFDAADIPVILQRSRFTKRPPVVQSGYGLSRAPLTYIWAVENVTDYFLSQRLVTSPPVMVDSLHKTVWSLQLLYGGQNQETIFCFLKREQDGDESGVENIEIDFEISILSADGSPLSKSRNRWPANMHKTNSRVLELVRKDVVFKRRAEFLPKNVLTLRCQVWNRSSETPRSELYFARSKVRVERRCFVWAVKGFGSLPLGQKTTLLVQPTGKGGPAPRLNIFLEDVDNEIVVTIEVEAGAGKERYGFQCEISVLDFEGKAFFTQGVRDFMYGRHEDCLRFSPFITRNELVTNKCLVLPNDVLSLNCAFEIVLARVSSRIEDYRQFSCFEIEAVVPAVEDSHDDEEEDSVSCCPLKKALASLYEEGTLSDINIRSGTESFPVHKNILSVRSPVFHAMFGTEMREKTSKDLDLPDVDANTLRRLLLFIYTDTVKDLGWESTSDLYRVADHYEVMDLREKCSTLLKSKLNESNVCSVLSLADMHHDQNLKRTVQNFIIFDLSIEFISSEEWKKFKVSNIQLALETMEHVFFKRKMEL
ncbi:TD and POZ domain-containing protein 4 [Trichonephila inaurata madagascariensis]|uniref:TD and POZ domain-containing protein 4 n=1 Tax=Trichonephila inaurata madagascariensis TaxID=2747483 RepID=A0A8X7BUR7_9ARAC|nr:TD and POZ domain-containing protein 4 [Trichonephila inaurata madagascariensis]